VQLELGNFHTCLRYAGGAMVCWGDVRGSIEDVTHGGGEGLRTSPIHRTDPRRATMLVPDMLDVRDMACAEASCCSLRSDDSVWCWGFAGPGAQKPGIFSHRGPDQVPERVPGVEGRRFIPSNQLDLLTRDGSRVVRMVSGAVLDFAWHAELPAPPSQYAHAGCVLSDDRVFCGGDNDFGQRGIGHIGYQEGDNNSQPVVGIDDAVEIAGDGGSRCALRPNGEVWCWGLYIPPDPDLPHPTPVRVEGLDHIIGLQFGDWHYCALRGDGQVLCWGKDQYSGGTLHTPGHGGERWQPYPLPDASDVVAMAVRGVGICVIRESGEVACNDGFPPELSEPEGWEYGDLVTIPHLPDLPEDFADEPTEVPEEPFDFDSVPLPPPEPHIVVL